MIELKGKYNTAKIFTDNIDNATQSQIIEMCNMEIFSGQPIRIMPDAHAGVGCVIGTTIKLSGQVLPSLVGVDIGCGVLTIMLRDKRIDLPKLDSAIDKIVKSNDRINTSTKFVAKVESLINDLKCKNSINMPATIANIGTLGGGNHFIEVDKDPVGNLYLIIHTGSRHLGVEIEKHYRMMALREYKQSKSNSIVQRIKELGLPNKETGARITKELADFSKEFKSNHAWLYYNCPLYGNLYSDYIHDMQIAQEYAAINRQVLADKIMKEAKLKISSTKTGWENFDTVHNYIDTNEILRKGSVSAEAGKKLIIPLNMRDGALLCIGKGNPDWNYSAPHGAGRQYSRSETKSVCSLSQYKSDMKCIFSSTINSSTLDECPMAYKDMNEILSNINDTVDVILRIIPIYNFKNGKDG